MSVQTEVDKITPSSLEEAHEYIIDDKALCKLIKLPDHKNSKEFILDCLAEYLRAKKIEFKTKKRDTEKRFYFAYDKRLRKFFTHRRMTLSEMWTNLLEQGIVIKV